MLVNLALVDAIVQDSARGDGRRLLLPFHDGPARPAHRAMDNRVGTTARAALGMLVHRSPAVATAPRDCAAACC